METVDSRPRVRFFQALRCAPRPANQSYLGLQLKITGGRDRARDGCLRRIHDVGNSGRYLSRIFRIRRGPDIGARIQQPDLPRGEIAIEPSAASATLGEAGEDQLDHMLLLALD